MKIALLTAYDSNFTSVGQLSNISKIRYCRIHNYSFILEHGMSPLHGVWLKIQLILKFIDNYNWIFWMDADSFILNYQIKIEDITDDKSDLIITSVNDVPVRQLNSGVFLIRNTPWSISFLKKVFHLRSKYPNYLGEQLAMIEVLNGITSSGNVDIENKIGFVKFIPQRTFNSYVSGFYGANHLLGEYQKGDFIMHLPAMDNKMRVDVIKKFLISYL